MVALGQELGYNIRAHADVWKAEHSSAFPA